jgi:RNA polymerase sigma factor (sigma-70 family)
LTEDETPEPTKELVDRALEGDPIACRAFVGALAPLVHVRVSALLRHRRAAGGLRCARHEAEDLVQIVFMKLFKEGGAVLRLWQPALGSLRAYVGVIAHNEAYDALKKSFAESPTSDDELDRILTEDVGAERWIEDRDRVRRVLIELSKRLRRGPRLLFELHFIDGRTVAEICEIAGMEENAVHQALRRIISLARKLAAELE